MYKVYQVQEGDSIDTIASKLGISISNLETINGLKRPYELFTGEYLVVPGGTSSQDFKVYEIKKGDTIYDIANKYNADYEQLLKLNGLNKNDYIYPGEEINVPNIGTKFYVTSENDTVNDIIRYLGKNPIEILNGNEKIYVKPDQLIYVKDN